jgi:hypothetical protein
MAAAALTATATRSLLRSPIARQVLQAGQQNVIPRFWTGEYNVIDQSRYVVDGGGHVRKEDLHGDSMLGQEMREKYNDVGLVHLQNTGLTDMGDQRLLARILMGEETEYEGGANPRGRNEELGNVYDIGAPLSAALSYHHGKFWVLKKCFIKSVVLTFPLVCLDRTHVQVALGGKFGLSLQACHSETWWIGWCDLSVGQCTGP